MAEFKLLFDSAGIDRAQKEIVRELMSDDSFYNLAFNQPGFYYASFAAEKMKARTAATPLKKCEEQKTE